MEKAFSVVKLKSVFSSPKPIGLASQVLRHLVLTHRCTHTDTFALETMSNILITYTSQTLRSMYVVETLIVGASAEVYSQTLT